jgi:hypothetical protein
MVLGGTNKKRGSEAALFRKGYALVFVLVYQLVS